MIKLTTYLEPRHLKKSDWETVLNALPEDSPLKAELIVNGRTKSKAAVYRVVVSHRNRKKTLYVALVDGQMTQANQLPNFTPLGLFTLYCALPLAKGKNVLLQQIICKSPASTRRKIIRAVKKVSQGGLLVFVGDIAGKCDGEILPHLNSPA